MCVVHLICEDGRAMCGKQMNTCSRKTSKELAEVTCVLCKLAYKENWKGRRPKD